MTQCQKRTESDETDNVCSVSRTKYPHNRDERLRRRPLTQRELSPVFITRFHTKYQKTQSCWLWTAAQYHQGYGMVNLGRDRLGFQFTAYAHRVAYVLAHGDIPADAVVMHACDVPACVNPAHLSLGTQRENLRDAVTRGRVRCGLIPGSVRWKAEQLRLGLRPDGRKNRKDAA